MANNVYTDEYIEKLFEFWYANGAPPATSLHKAIIQNKDLQDEQGRCPSAATITLWLSEKGFYARKDLLDAKVATKIDEDLVALKVNALREQAALFRQIRIKAANHLLETDFDSSSAAVNAFIRASQEERISLGLSRTIQKMAGMDDDDLLRHVKELASRVSGDVLTGEEVSVEEDEE